MSDHELECGECGEHFGSEEILNEHFQLEHPGKKVRSAKVSNPSYRKFFSKHLNSSALLGFTLGIIMTSSAIAGGIYVQEYLDEEISITVVTCGNCTYERFKSRTDRVMNTDYTEMDYQSEKGQKLIEKYNLTYIPGFIYEKDLENHENFTQVRSALIKYEDAYVMTDKADMTAQRFSEGISLDD